MKELERLLHEAADALFLVGGTRNNHSRNDTRHAFSARTSMGPRPPTRNNVQLPTRSLPNVELRWASSSDEEQPDHLPVRAVAACASMDLVLRRGVTRTSALTAGRSCPLRWSPVLQRGPTGRRQERRRRAGRASMEPRPSTRNNRRRAPASSPSSTFNGAPSSDEDQRGAGRRSSESRPPFNGAPSSDEEQRAALAGDAVEEVPSMEPRPPTRINTARHACRATLDTPSMEPVLRRGSTLGPDDRLSNIYILQWSPVLRRGSTRWVWPVPIWNGRLQWSPVLRRGSTTTRGMPRERLGGPSMEPRPPTRINVRCQGRRQGS